MAFTDQNKIPEEAKRAVAFLTGNLHCISGYEDGAFHPERYMKRGEFCKMLLNSVTRREIYIDLAEMTGAGKWKEAIDSWAGRYILFFRTVIVEAEKNCRHTKRAHVLLNRYFDWEGVITKREAFQWSQMFFETEFSLESSFCSRKIYRKRRKNADDTPAERSWLCQLIYEIFQKAAQHFYERPEELKELLLNGVNFTGGERPRLNFLCLEPKVYREKKDLVRKLKELSKDYEHTTWSGCAYQYTSLVAVYKMLQAKNGTIKGHPSISLRLSNTAYLNDPKEGALFNDIIQKILNTERGDLRDLRGYFNGNAKNLYGEAEIGTSEVYVASLSYDKEERLPMWVQYGDWGRGCRIEFEISEQDRFRMLEYYCKNELPFEEVKNCIINQSSLAVQLTFVGILKDFLEKEGLQYLYKEKYYAHENEVRVLKKASPDKKIYTTENIRDGEVFPRLYLESDTNLKLLSVTLGA